MDHEDLDVDVSVLTALIELRKEHDLLDGYCRRAEELRLSVDETVFERVLGDYGTRRRALDEQAAPLKTRARAEYRTLRLLYARVQRTLDTARLQKEEMEFRHQIGEIDEASLAERVREPDEILGKCAAEIAALDEQEALFREACPDLPTGDEALAEVPEPMPEAPRDARAEVTAEAEDEAEDKAETEDEAEDERDLTREVSGVLGEAEGPPHASHPELTSPAEAVDDPPADAAESGEDTFIVPLASLVSDEDNGASVNYQLGALNHIGRSLDNELQLSSPGVSRRHAVVMATATGYVIRDLNSQNGTYLNGDCVKEGPLKDGDRISIGKVDLAFRTAVSHHGGQSRSAG